MVVSIKLLFLILALPAGFIVSLAAFAGFSDFLNHEKGDKSSKGIAKLYALFIQFLLVLIFVPMVGDVFDQLSDEAAILIVLGGTFTALPFGMLFVGNGNKRALEKLQLAGWICGVLLIVIVAIRYLVKQ